MGYQNVNFPENTLFLVTGGAGFIGSNLCEAILKKGCKVRCLDDLSTGKQENVDIFKENPNYTFIKGDIKDLGTCMKACEGVDYVLNEAAWGSVPRSIQMPLLDASLLLCQQYPGNPQHDGGGPAEQCEEVCVRFQLFGLR